MRRIGNYLIFLALATYAFDLHAQLDSIEYKTKFNDFEIGTIKSIFLSNQRIDHIRIDSNLFLVELFKGNQLSIRYMASLNSNNEFVQNGFFEGFINGKLSHRSFMRSNQIISNYDFDSTGNLECEIQFNSNPIGDKKIYYYENGQIKEIGFIKNGIRTGLWKTYYENGVVSSEGNYSISSHFEDNNPMDTIFNKGGSMTIYRKTVDLKNGKWKYYDELGNYIKLEEYSLGKLLKAKKVKK